MKKRKINVLVCEDNSLMAHGLRVLLEQFTDLEIVGFAKDGSQAVAKAATMHPDVVLMDLGLPELDGIAAMKIMKSDRPYVRVVVVSASQDEQLLKSALEAGADGFFPKPVMSAEGLYMAIMKALDPVTT